MALRSFGMGMLLLAAALAPLRSRAEGTVTDCTEAAFRAALAGGGEVLFDGDCTLSLAGGIAITNDTVIDSGGNSVLIDGGGHGPMFLVGAGVQFQLIGFTLRNCAGTNGGAIYISQDAVAVLTNCTLAGNRATGANGAAGVAGADSTSGNGADGTDGGSGNAASGGAIYNLGSLTLLDCVVNTNSAAGGTGGDGGKGGTGRWNGGNGGAGGTGASGTGGAICNLGSLVVSNCSLIGNSVTGGHGGFGGLAGTGSSNGRDGEGAAPGAALGAAIYSPGTATIVNSTLASNTARGGDAGDGGEQLNGNGTDGLPGGNARGAGLWTGGSGALTNSTFFNNKATGGAGGYGGSGFWNAGKGGNGGDASGGGIHNKASLLVVNCTITACGTYGGTNGIAGHGLAPVDGSMGVASGGDLANNASNRLVLKNSIVATPLAGGNISGTYKDAGNNVRTNPALGTLADNGGPTLTIAPLAGSPAIHAADNAWAPPFDQRGFERSLSGGPTDIGAVEGVGVTIVTNPVSLMVTNGANVRFTVTAAGETPLKYYWKFNGTNIAFATNSTYIITNVTAANVGAYAVAVSNTFGGAISAPAQLTIGSPILLLTQPSSFAVFAGSDVSFSVTATGTDPIAYQWLLNGTNLAGAVTNPLVLLNVQTNDSGLYSAVLSNALGSVSTTGAVLTVLAPASLSQAVLTTNQFSFAFPTRTNVTYVIDRKGSLAETNWTPWKTNLALTTGWITNQDFTTNGPSGFYRLRLQ